MPQQISWREGLNHIVVSPGVFPGFDIRRVAFSRDNNNWWGSRTKLLFDLIAYFQARHAWQHYIQQDDAWDIFQGHFERIIAIRGDAGFVASEFEFALNHKLNVGIIFSNENILHVCNLKDQS